MITEKANEIEVLENPAPIEAPEQEHTIYAPGMDEADSVFISDTDAMSGAGIREGDLVYINLHDEVKDGEVALVELGALVTLRRIYHSGNHVILRPDNPAYELFLLSAEEAEAELEIIGKAVAVLSAIR